MGYIPQIEWEDNATNTERLRAIYNFLNNLLFEMYGGRVPGNKEELQNNIDLAKVPLSIAFVKMAENGEIDDITASEHMEMFLEWNENGDYKTGNLRTYTTQIENEYGELMNEVNLYKCLQDHKGQAGWTPDKVPALWKLIVVSQNGVPYWSQPISQQDAYMKDDEVINPNDGFVWVSDLDYNVWKPGEYGWHLKKS